MNDSAINKRKLVLIFTLSIILVAFIVLLISRNTGKGGESGAEFVSPDSPAYMSYKNDAYLPTRNPDTDNQLRADVAFFARKVFPDAYNPEKQPGVLFSVSGEPTRKDSSYSFSGTYEKVQNKIDISFTVLKNRRIKTSITDKTTGKNIDDQLPSNSARNQYIATLPVLQRLYTIDYLSNSDSFIVTLYDSSARDEALRALQAGLKINSLNNVNYKVLTPSSASEGAPPG